MPTEISLVGSPLDAVLGEDGQWTGPGAEHLNRGRLDWPTRLDFLREGGPEEATIELIEASDGGSYDLEHAKSELAGGTISVATFKVIAKVGARITGCVWVEGSRTADEFVGAYVESPEYQEQELVTVQEGDFGPLKLRVIALDATLLPNHGEGARWTGPGSAELNAAIERGGFLFWPQRIDQIVLHDAELRAGFPHPSFGICDQQAIDLREKTWPVADRKTMIPNICTFSIDGAAGSRITGRLLVEIH